MTIIGKEALVVRPAEAFLRRDIYYTYARHRKLHIIRFSPARKSSLIPQFLLCGETNDMESAMMRAGTEQQPGGTEH